MASAEEEPTGPVVHLRLLSLLKETLGSTTCRRGFSDWVSMETKRAMMGWLGGDVGGFGRLQMRITSGAGDEDEVLPLSVCARVYASCASASRMAREEEEGPAGRFRFSLR
jgi:hypothetical protein